jgi:hypothetical protein
MTAEDDVLMLPQQLTAAVEAVHAALESRGPLGSSV